MGTLNKTIYCGFLFLFFSAGIFSNVSAQAANEKGRLLVGKTDSAPVLDGELNDPCWQNAIEVSSFVLQSQNQFAREQTRVCLSYDDKNLYLAFWCGEFALDPVNNILNEFKKNVRKADDDKIFNDDVVVVLLDRNNDQDTFYDIFINAANAVNDAACSGKDPWGTRDKKWNSDARVTVKVNNGFWVVETAIPFSSLGESPKSGDAWGVCLGRIEQNKNESSTWQPMKGGFHNATEFGEIVFGKEVPGLRSVQIGNFSRGENKLTLQAQKAKHRFPLRIETVIAYSEGETKIDYKDYVPFEEKEISYSYFLDKDGAVLFQYKILNPATFQTYYRSPIYSSLIQNSFLRKGKVTAGAAYKIYLNGQEISKGAPFYQGENVLAIETEGPISAEFAVGDFIFSTDGAWRYSEIEEEGWREKGFSDQRWTIFESKNGDLISEKEKKGFFRKTILFKHSRFWPDWEKEGIWIAENSIQQLFLVPQGLKGKELNGYSFYLEVPEEVKILGGSSYYGKIPKLSCRLEKTVTRGGKTYDKYLIAANDVINFQKEIPSWQFCSIPVQMPVSGKNFSVRETTFYYYLKAEQGTVEEIPQTLKVNILPPIKGKQPSRYLWEFWPDWLSAMNNKALQEQILSFFPEAGFNDVMWFGTLPDTINLKNASMINFSSYIIDCKPYLEKHPEDALVDNVGIKHISEDGKENQEIPNYMRNLICTTLLVQDSPAWSYMKKAIGDWVKKNKIDHVDWDFEDSVWNSYIACYCPRCLKKIREFAAIPETVNLTPEVIKKEYSSQWIRFMNIRMALLAGQFRQAVKEADPRAVFSVYSGYQSDRTEEEYGVDWSLLADKIDRAMCGYGRPEKELTDTLAAIGKIPLVIGMIVYPYDVKSKDYPTAINKAFLLRGVTDGNGGILIYSLTQMDGRTFYASAETARLISEYEDLFIAHHKDNSLVTVTGISSEDVVVFSDDKTRLVILFNDGRVKKQVRVVNRQFNPAMKVSDYYTGKELGNLPEIITDIPPLDAKVFIIR